MKIDFNRLCHLAALEVKGRQAQQRIKVLRIELFGAAQIGRSPSPIACPEAS
jgi:hypothetical protein